MTQPIDPEFLKVAIEFLRSYPGLEVALQGDHAITKDLRTTLFQYGFLSDAQVELAFKIHEEKVAKTARAELLVESLEEGRRRITGTIISTKLQDSDWGPTPKMLIEEDNGNRLYGTIPKNLRQRVNTHDVVRFDAEVSPSNDDEHFGFFKRPTNAERVG